LTNVTFFGNISVAPRGGAIDAEENCSVAMGNSIVFGNAGGFAIECDSTSDAFLTCCDMYGNEGGDWTGCAEGQLGVDGNISQNPLFCDVWENDFTLCEDSPCAPEANPACGLVGALPVACDPCGPTATERTSWGSLKAMFR
jgi:predicted outer membrane repeat protein